MQQSLYKQQQKLRQEFDRKKEDTRTIKISQAHEIKEYEIKKFATNLTGTVASLICFNFLLFLRRNFGYF